MALAGGSTKVLCLPNFAEEDVEARRDDTISLHILLGLALGRRVTATVLAAAGTQKIVDFSGVPVAKGAPRAGAV